MKPGPVANAPTETALILPVHLPRALEELRRRAIRDAPSGLPAHVTLLYPLVPPESMDRSLRALIAEVVESHTSFPYTLTGPVQWPDTLCALTNPARPLHSLQGDLAMAFPTFPIYGGAFPFVPHVTIAGREWAGDPAIATDRAWGSLPATVVASRVELIVRDARGWRLRWRFTLRAS